MDVFEVNIAELKHAPYNPRRISEEQMAMLQKSLTTFGFVDPIVVNRRNQVIVGGHQRVIAWAALGHQTLPVVYVDLDEAQERALNLALNKTGGEFDLDKLKDLIFELGELGFDDFELTGFNAAELDALCQSLSQAQTAIDIEEDEAPEPPEVAKTQPGDLYQLGQHRLLCGDATVLTHVQRLMGEDQADMVFTDPPYNVDYTGKTADALTIQNDKMSNEKFYQFLLDAFANMAMLTKPGSAIYICHADSEGLNFRTAMVSAGWLLKQCIIWNKNAFVMGRQDYHWKHEPILYGWLLGASHNWFGDRKQCTVWDFDKPQRNGEHPTMKPVSLVAYAIQNSTMPGHIVMDLFGGSGSTLMACEQTGRVCRTVEFDPKYCDVIVQRWEKYTGRSAELVKGGALNDSRETDVGKTTQRKRQSLHRV